jgi:hypothetical protein
MGVGKLLKFQIVIDQETVDQQGDDSPVMRKYAGRLWWQDVERRWLANALLTRCKGDDCDNEVWVLDEVIISETHGLTDVTAWSRLSGMAHGDDEDWMGRAYDRALMRCARAFLEEVIISVELNGPEPDVQGEEE